MGVALQHPLLRGVDRPFVNTESGGSGRFWFYHIACGICINIDTLTITGLGCGSFRLRASDYNVSVLNTQMDIMVEFVYIEKSIITLL